MGPSREGTWLRQSFEERGGPAQIITLSPRLTPEHLTELGDYCHTGDTEMAETPHVVAPVQSPASSSINWAAIMGPIASMAAYVGLHVDAETLVQVVIGIQAVVSLYVVVKNTF